VLYLRKPAKAGICITALCWPFIALREINGFQGRHLMILEGQRPALPT